MGSPACPLLDGWDDGLAAAGDGMEQPRKLMALSSDCTFWVLERSIVWGRSSRPVASCLLFVGFEQKKSDSWAAGKGRYVLRPDIMPLL